MKKALTMFVSFGLRQVVGANTERVSQDIEEYFKDTSQVLPEALKSANERAWQSLEIAIVGESFSQRFKQWMTSQQVKAFSYQVEVILSKYDDDFRKECLLEMNRLRGQGEFQAVLDGAELADLCQTFDRFTEPQRLIDGAWRVMDQCAELLKMDGFKSLGILLQHKTEDGPPLLLAAFGYFLRREVAKDEHLNDELYFDALRNVSRQQIEGFQAVHKAIKVLGDDFQLALDSIVHQLNRVESTVNQTQQTVESIDATQAEILQHIKEMKSHLERKQEIKPRVLPKVVEDNALNNLQAPKHQTPKLGKGWQTYTLKVVCEPAEAGRVIGSGDYSPQQVACIEAMPYKEWQFSHWSGDVTSAELKTEVLMDSTKSIKAHFIAVSKMDSETASNAGGRLGKAFR